MGKIVLRGAQIFLDLLALSIAFWLAFLFRFEFRMEMPQYKLLFFSWPYVVMFKYLVMVLFGVHNFSWRYVGVREASRIFGALATASLFLIALRLGLGGMGGHSKWIVIPLGVLAIDFSLSFMGVAGIRFLRRISAEKSERGKWGGTASVAGKKTLLVGAGRAGVLVAKEVQQNPGLGIEVVGFIDDDTMKTGTVIQGHKVLGDTASIPAIAEETDAEQAIICIASAPGASIRRIVEACEDADLSMKIIPGIYEILDGRVSLNRLREVSIEDLLGREAIELDMHLIKSFITGKRVLVTGAGGSIGSELCRQVIRFNPEKLLLLEQNENSLFEIDMELQRKSREEGRRDVSIVPIIADICDKRRIERVFQIYRPQIVFHAAAHKHVPMMEINPGEALKNNVLGTKCVADTAEEFVTEAFVMISTDKAVNPTSVMGGSKRLAEMYIHGKHQRVVVSEKKPASTAKSKFVSVRFGNVLGSAGSVIPIFKEQISKGGPVTVTHPEMKRYFMTIPEACQLVMQASAMGRGGELFVLDMGKPVKIVQLAQDLIRLSGLSDDDIEISFTGIRPGEKLFEEFTTADENMTKTLHPKIFIGKAAYEFDAEEFDEMLRRLPDLAERYSPKEIRCLLQTLIPEMREPACDDPAPSKTDNFSDGDTQAQPGVSKRDEEDADEDEDEGEKASYEGESHKLI